MKTRLLKKVRKRFSFEEKGKFWFIHDLKNKKIFSYGGSYMFSSLHIAVYAACIYFLGFMEIINQLKKETERKRKRTYNEL